MSIRSKALRTWLPAVLLGVASTLVGAQPLDRLTFDSQSFGLQRQGGKPVVTQKDAGGSITRIVADSALSKATRSATTLFVLGGRSFESEGHRFLVLATSRPSTRTNGQGYCGAGTEDELLLVRWSTQQHLLKLQDSMLVQSCLKSITLASDQGTQLEAALGKPAELDPLELTWLTHPQYEGQSRRYKVVAGKWKAL